MRKIPRTVALVPTVALVVGCARTLVVREGFVPRGHIANDSATTACVVVPERPWDAAETALAADVAEEMERSFGLRCSTDETWAPPEAERVAVGLTVSGEPSPWNFLVSFPGYLVFAPSLVGYGYSQEVVLTTRSGETVRRVSFELSVRQTARDRAWPPVAGWLGWPIVPLAAGVHAATSYDPDATRELLEGPSGDEIVELASREAAAILAPRRTDVP